MEKSWTELTEKEIQTEIAINLSKIASILEMAFQPEIRQFLVNKKCQEDKEQLKQEVEQLKQHVETLSKGNNNV